MKTKSYSVNRLFLILATAVSLSFANTHAQAPMETVGEGFNPSVYVEPDGTVHTVYFTNYGNEQKLTYATRKISGDWKYRTLGLAVFCGDLYMTMDKAGNIHIVMSDYRWEENPKSRLFYGMLTKEGQWSRRIIAVSWTRLISMALKADSKDELHLTYLESDYPARWMEMHTAGGTWSKPVSFGDHGYNCLDMTLDKDDNQHVSLYNLVYGPLAYLHKPAGGEWSVPEMVDPEWGGGQLEGLVTSIYTDSEMNPYISYVGSENHDSHQHTRYAWKKNGIWHNTLVDRGQFQSGGNKIVIDQDGAVHLAYSYFHEELYKLKDVRYATNITGKWIKQTLGSQVDAINVDMGVDRNNYAHVVYGGHTQDYTQYIYYNKVKISRYFDVSPDSLDFRGVLPGGEKTIAMTLTNTLGSDVVIDSIVIDESRITTDRSSFTVAAHSEEVVNVSIDMTAAVWKDKELNIWFGGSVITIPVLATNYQPELVVNPDPVDVGAVLLGSTVTKTITLKNNGIMDLNISKIEVKYELFPGYVIATDFKLVGHNCTVLRHWETCQAEISFKPMKTGSQQSYLVISSNNPAAPVKKVKLTGKTAHPYISSSLYDVDFGYCAVGQSITKTLKITNAGEVKLAISSIAVSGTHSTQFAMSHTCSELEPGDSCKIQVTMTPSMLADLTATLTITSNSFYSGTLNIPLHGTSVVRKLEIFPATIDFGVVDLGKKAFKLVEFRNTGSGSIVLSGIKITGADPDEFYQEISCQTIPEGQSCTDTVWYTPTFEGIKSSLLVVSSNDPFHPVQTVSLAGGTGASLPLSVSINAVPPTGTAPVYVNFSAVITGGEGPFWYRWDIENIGTYTEDPDPRIQFSKPGIYTIILKLTDINNRSASDTIDLVVASAGIPLVSAIAEPVSGEIPLTVHFDAMVAGGDPPLSYFWNFRDGGTSTLLNPSHTYTGQGTYWAKITINDNNGDAVSDSVLITAKWNTCFSGQLWDDDAIYAINESVVRFIQKTNIMNVWTDILEGTNEYSFRNLHPGEYTVLAIPDTGTYPQYLPTYLGSKLLLNEALWVNMNGYITGQDIRLIKKPPPNYGNGSFWGSVGILSNPKKSSGEAKGENLAGIYIYLRDATTYELVDYDITDEYGSFSFEDLEEGSYLIYVDYRGLPMDPANTVLVVGDGIYELEMGITISDEKITVNNLTTGLNESIPGKLRVYPVPAEKHILVEVPDGIFSGNALRMRILDLSGKIVYLSQKLDLSGNRVTLDINHLSNGIYFLEVTDSRTVLRKMIMKMR